jgi:predicted aspartyl protease
LLFVGLVAPVAGCDGSNAPSYTGTLQPAPAIVNADTFLIEGTLDGVDSLLFVDTGAPITLLSPQFFTDLKIGPGTLKAHLFGVDFDALPVVLSNFDDIQVGTTVPVVGLLGGDLLRHFTASFDYAGARVILGETWPTLPEIGTNANPIGSTINFELLGGGVYPVSDGTQVPVQRTRIVLDAVIEGQSVVAVVDSGASFVVLNPGFFNSLPTAGRPMLQGVQLGTVMGSNDATVSRVKSLKVGDAEITSAEVAVVPDFQFVQSLQAETQRPVEALIGATFLREFLFSVNYPQQQLTLHKYSNRDHIDDSRFHRVGIFLGLKQSAFGSVIEIASVVKGSDAEKQGVTVNDLPYSIAGKQLETFTDGADIDAALQGTVGSRVTVGLLKNGDRPPQSFDLLIEDLLPPFQ